MKTILTGEVGLAREQITLLEDLGYEITLLQDPRQPVETPEIFEAAVCGHLFEGTPLGRFTGLKLIQLMTAGYDYMPMDEVRSRGIRFFNASGVYSAPMAEHAILGVLQLYKKSRFFYGNQRVRVWEKDKELLEFAGKRVLILGAGSIGTECARRFDAFGVREIVGVARTAGDRPYFDRVVGMDGLDACLGESDIVLCALPAAPETHHLLDARRLGLMKEGAVFLNLSRGAVVDEAALCAALADGKLLGAVLDVFEEEPLPKTSPLWGMENVILTPHSSFGGEYNNERLFSIIYGNLKRVMEEVL